MKKKAQTTKEYQPRSNSSFQEPSRKSAKGEDIIELILNDHVPLKALIETLKDDKLKRRAKEGPFEEFVFLLTGHAKAEEKTLYVAMKNFESLKVQSFEGDTEHGIADQLVQEINSASDDHEWLAKVKVLAESVEHHIEEEEEEILKKVESQISEPIRMAIGAEYTLLLQEYLALNAIRVPPHVHFKKQTNLPPVARL